MQHAQIVDIGRVFDVLIRHDLTRNVTDSIV